MTPSRLIRLCLAPELAMALSLTEWSLLIRQARAANLLAYLADTLARAGLLEQLPEPPKRHLQSALKLVQRQRQSVLWEIERLEEALSPLEQPFVLLKGAAYIAADLPVATGRLLSDIDILVAEQELNHAEQLLAMNGWHGARHHPYDDRYYRTWMHELPPLLHLKRQSLLDVHHRILPRTCRNSPDPATLMADSRPLAGFDQAHLPSNCDLVLHSAIHLFHESELHHGLRDLFDLRQLFSLFGSQPLFWQQLVDRAAEWQQQPALFYACRYVEMLLDGSVPETVHQSLADSAPARPILKLMDYCYRRVLQPQHPSCAPAGASIAQTSLYLRGHYLRMPLYLLIPHLLRKSLRGDD